MKNNTAKLRYISDYLLVDTSFFLNTMVYLYII